MCMALQVNDKDNVATVFSEGVLSDCFVTIHNKRGEQYVCTAKSSIPYAHKIAIKTIHRGDHVVKYGESLGLATQDIQIGEHVHVHNLESERGRGDK